MPIFLGIILPFVGTTLGATMVFLLKGKLNIKIQKVLIGFAVGVMLAASIWSLIIPAIESSTNLGHFSFLPAAIGFLGGMGFLLLLDSIIPHLHLNSDKPEGLNTGFKKNTMLMFAVTLHNIPEGMAVGVALAGALYGNEVLTISSAIALSIGIAIQNFPEGAIISMPLNANGETKSRSFFYGTLSGIVEPIAALITLLLTKYIAPILPYILSFAAGAMVYVVVEELIPEASEGEHSNLSTIAMAIGFVLMMSLDVALG